MKKAAKQKVRCINCKVEFETRVGSEVAAHYVASPKCRRPRIEKK